MEHIQDKISRVSALVAPAPSRKRSSFASTVPLTSQTRGKIVPRNAREVIERLGGKIKTVGGGSYGVMKGITKAAEVVLEVPVPTLDKNLDEGLGRTVKGMGFDLVLSKEGEKQRYLVRYSGPAVHEADKLAEDALRTVGMVEEREAEKRKLPVLSPVPSTEERQKAAEEICEDAARAAGLAGGSLKVEAGVSYLNIEVELPVATADKQLDEDLAERLAMVGIELAMQKSGGESRYVVKCSTTNAEKADVLVKKAVNAAEMIAEAEPVKERKRHEREQREKRRKAMLEHMENGESRKQGRLYLVSAPQPAAA